MVRPQISHPALTHGYFTQSQNKRQGITTKAIARQKCPSDTPRPKPNTGPSNKAKKQMMAALDSGQSVTSQKMSGRGWTNKAQMQDGTAPTNDTNAPSHSKSGKGSKESKAQVGWGLSLNPAVLHKKQLEDPDIGPILKWKESSQRPFGLQVCASSPVTRHYWNCWALLQIQDGMLMCHFIRWDTMGDHLQFIVPRSLHNRVLHLVHDSLLGGHLGQKETRQKALQRFYWCGIREDCNNWVVKCDECAKVKHPLECPMHSWGDVSWCPFDRLSTDILGPFPESTQGNKYVLAVTVYFTKWVEIFAIPDQSAVTCAGVIINKVIARFGCPYDIHSDQGCNYENAIFFELVRMPIEVILGVSKNPNLEEDTSYGDYVDTLRE